MGGDDGECQYDSCEDSEKNIVWIPSSDGTQSKCQCQERVLNQLRFELFTVIDRWHLSSNSSFECLVEAIFVEGKFTVSGLLGFPDKVVLEKFLWFARDVM